MGGLCIIRKKNLPYVFAYTRLIYCEINIKTQGYNFRGFRGSLKPRKLKSNEIQLSH